MKDIIYELYYNGKLVGKYETAVQIAKELLVTDQAVYRVVNTRSRIGGEYTVKRRMKGSEEK